MPPRSSNHRPKSTIVLACVAGVLVLLLLWDNGQNIDSVDSQAGLERTEESAEFGLDETRTRIQAGAQVGQIEAQGTPGEGFFGWKGVVLDASGEQPQPDATVVASTDFHRSSTRTNSQGEFTLEWTQNWNATRGTIVATSELGMGLVSVAPSKGGADTQILLSDPVLTCTVQLDPIDSDGAPAPSGGIAFARGGRWTVQAECDEDGIAELHVPMAASFYANCEVPGWHQVDSHYIVPSDDQRRISQRIKVKPIPPEFHLQVVDLESNQPIVDSEVQSIPHWLVAVHDPAQLAINDKGAGEFQLTWGGAGYLPAIRVEADGYLAWEGWLASREIERAELAQLLPFTVRLIDNQGNAVADMEVAWSCAALRKKNDRSIASGLLGRGEHRSRFEQSEPGVYVGAVPNAMFMDDSNFEASAGDRDITSALRQAILAGEQSLTVQMGGARKDYVVQFLNLPASDLASNLRVVVQRVSQDGELIQTVLEENLGEREQVPLTAEVGQYYGVLVSDSGRLINAGTTLALPDQSVLASVELPTTRKVKGYVASFDEVPLTQRDRLIVLARMQDDTKLVGSRRTPVNDGGEFAIEAFANQSETWELAASVDGIAGPPIQVRASAQDVQLTAPGAISINWQVVDIDGKALQLVHVTVLMERATRSTLTSQEGHCSILVEEARQGTNAWLWKEGYEAKQVSLNAELRGTVIVLPPARSVRITGVPAEVEQLRIQAYPAIYKRRALGNNLGNGVWEIDSAPQGKFAIDVQVSAGATQTMFVPATVDQVEYTQLTSK